MLQGLAPSHLTDPCIVSPPLRHSDWQVSLCWLSPHLEGSWGTTAPSQLLCQDYGISFPYTSGSLTHFLSGASQKLTSFLWLFSAVGETALYCFCLLLYICLVYLFLFVYSILAKCRTDKVELTLNVTLTLPGKLFSQQLPLGRSTIVTALKELQ